MSAAATYFSGITRTPLPRVGWPRSEVAIRAPAVA